MDEDLSEQLPRPYERASAHAGMYSDEDGSSVTKKEQELQEQEVQEASDLHKDGDQTDSALPSNWPQGPRILAKDTVDLTLSILTDILLLVISAAFLLFGLIVLCYNGQEVDQGRTIANALQFAGDLGGTILPILFAATVGRCIRSLMLWRLERGETLGTLDMLAGSTTVGGALSTQIMLRSPSIFGTILVSTWAMSPLGSQASLRVYSVGTTPVSYNREVTYASLNQTFAQWQFTDRGNANNVVQGLFNAAILSPETVKLSVVDAWNNIKIPALELINQVESDSWTHVPANVEYSALVGLPRSHLPEDWNHTFSVETSYLYVDCFQLSNQTLPENVMENATPMLQDSYQDTVVSTSTSWWAVRNPAETYILTNSSGNNEECRHNSSDHNVVPRTFGYSSVGVTGNTFGALCSLETSYVEIELECQGNEYRVSRMRKSTLDNPQSAWTVLDGLRTEGPSCGFWTDFARLFVNTFPERSWSTSTPLQQYMINPLAPHSLKEQNAISEIRLDWFSLRLQQLFNSLLIVCAGPYAIPNGLDQDISEDDPYMRHFRSQRRSTTVKSWKMVETISCQYKWLVAPSVVCLLLIGACLLSIFLRTRRRMPEIALICSTMARDSPHLATGGSGSSMDSWERSRLVRNTRVKFGDVSPWEFTGRLTIASLDNGHSVATPQRGR